MYQSKSDKNSYQEYGPPPGKMSIDELRVMRAKIKEDYEKSLTEFDAQRMEQVDLFLSASI